MNEVNLCKKNKNKKQNTANTSGQGLSNFQETDTDIKKTVSIYCDMTDLIFSFVVCLKGCFVSLCEVFCDDAILHNRRTLMYIRF